MENCDVLVVGAGIAGASAAFELSGSGSVIVLERESQPGYHTTGRSAAFYTQHYGNRHIRALTQASRDFFDSSEEGMAGPVVLNRRGALFIAREDQLATLDIALAEIRKTTPGLRLSNTAEALTISPALDPAYVAAAIFEPEASDIDVHAVHYGYLGALRQRGGQLITNAGVTAVTREGGLWKIETPAGSFASPVVINAAGAWCDVVAGMAGVRPVGLVPKRRTMFTFEAPPGLDISAWPLTIDIDEEFYFKPDAGLILASPADETPSPPCDTQPEEIDVAVAVDRLQTATTLKVPRIASKWAGLRSFVADKTPVVGMDEAADGFFWLAGQGGYGIQTAPAMARAAAALITTGDLPRDLARLGLTRSDLAPERLR